MEEKPGAPPPPTEKPRPISNSSPSFSFNQLEFTDAVKIDNRKYLRFFVMSPENPCYIDILQGEYLDYFIYYTDLLANSENQEICTCDVCQPQYEDLGNEVTETIIYIDENKIEKEETFKYKCYFVYNLVEKLQFSIHKSHDNI